MRAAKLCVPAIAMLIGRPIQAQSVGASRALLAPWTVDAGAGVLAQPRAGGGAGPAVSLAAARRIGDRSVAVSLLVIGSRASDVGVKGANRFIYDRDWVITGAGISTTPLVRQRTSLGFEAQGAVLWSRDRRVGQEGTPVQPGFPDLWSPGGDSEVNPALVLGVRFAVRLGAAVDLAARTSMVQHLFSDDFLGATGGLASLGLAIRTR